MHLPTISSIKSIRLLFNRNWNDPCALWIIIISRIKRFFFFCCDDTRETQIVAANRMRISLTEFHRLNWTHEMGWVGAHRAKIAREDMLENSSDLSTYSYHNKTTFIIKTMHTKPLNTIRIGYISNLWPKAQTHTHIRIIENTIKMIVSSTHICKQKEEKNELN